MEEIVLSTIKKYNMIEKNDVIVAGISGGADSISMLYILNKLKVPLNIQIIVVHINHNIRKEDALKDALFVQDICKKMDILCKIIDVDVKKIASDLKLGEEEAGRFIRYEKFLEIKNEYNANKVAIAHNKNDQAETFLMRLSRGTGLKGLCGIAPVREHIIRPLIACDRQQIENYCLENNIDFKNDYTNDLNIYTRNKIRNELIPKLTEINKNVVANIYNCSQIITEDNNYLEKVASEHFLDAIVLNEALNEEKYLVLNCYKLYDVDIAILRRVIILAVNTIKPFLKDLTFKQIDSVIKLILNRKNGKINIKSNIIAEFEYDNLKFYVKKDGLSTKFSYNLQFDEAIYLKNVKKYVELSCNITENLLSDSKIYTIAIDCDRIETGVVRVRNRCAGDKIYLKGFNGHKSLKKFFIDEKIPKEIRETVPVVAIGSDVIWIFGYKISDYFIATKHTKNVGYIKFWEED